MMNAPFGKLKLTEIKPRGWISTQMERDLRGFAGHLHELCKEARADIFTTGRVSGDELRTWWDGETEGNWIDGLTRMAYATQDTAAIEHVEQYLKRIIREAEKDGYIGIYKENWRFRNDGQNGEPWTFSRVLLALLAHYDVTGSQEALDAITASVSLFIKHYSVSEGGVSYFEVGDVEHDLGKSHGLMVIEPLLFVYDIVGDDAIINFVRELYNDFSDSNVTAWGYDCQLHRLLDPHEPFIGHGAHTCEHLRIPLLLYFYTGEEKYKTAYENAFLKLNDYVSVSGACKSDEMIGNGLVGCPPLPSVGYEYCAVTEQLLSLHFAAMLTGEGKYADQAEWLLFNAAQALKSHDGMGIAYLGSDNQREASKRVGTRWDISPTHDDEAVCCVPNAVRILPYHSSRMWMSTNDGGLALMFYGPSVVETEVGGRGISIEQRTAYPFESGVSLRVSASEPVEFPLKLRIPSWSKRTHVHTNGGGDVRISREGDYYVLNGTWSDGDEISIEFEMSVEAVQAADRTIALRRGPLLFAMDIPAKQERTRSYEIGEFSDIDYLPETDKAWEYTLQIEREAPDLSCSVVRGETDYVWDAPSLQLKVNALNSRACLEEITLVPIGCTLLRRTCFSYVEI